MGVSFYKNRNPDNKEPNQYCDNSVEAIDSMHTQKREFSELSSTSVESPRKQLLMGVAFLCSL